MDEKEVNDPLNNVSLINGNSFVLFYYFENTDRQNCSDLAFLFLLSMTLS